jgi:hypothetical protein
MSRVSEAADAYAESFRGQWGFPSVKDPLVSAARRGWLAGFDAGVQALWNRVALFDREAPELRAEVQETIQAEAVKS